MTLYCATTNSGKLREFRLVVRHHAADVIDLEALAVVGEIPAPEEHGATFEENAAIKALYYSGRAPGLLFADDSGLEVDALGGAPGVYSARYAGEHATDEANNRLLLARLDGVEDRRARFVCAVALAERGRLLGTYRGAVEGVILREPRGSEGFGYDPLFFHAPFGCTFGEVSAERKLLASHRGVAIAELVRALLSGHAQGQ